MLLYQKRADYNLGARAHPEASLNDTKSDLRQSDWYRVASGKGVLLLHDLRTRIGAEKFDALMEQFGVEHGGKPTSAADFETFMVENTGVESKEIDGLLNGWLVAPGLPRFKIGSSPVVQVIDSPAGKRYRLTFDLEVESNAVDCSPWKSWWRRTHGEVRKTVTPPFTADRPVSLAQWRTSRAASSWTSTTWRPRPTAAPSRP